jgi:microcompartment protein CcmL/EutN
MTHSLGFVEVPSLSIAALVGDAAAKAAQVSILGFEATGNENILIRLGGDVADIEAALTAANQTATRLGVSAIVQSIPRPAEGMEKMIYFPNMQNPLFGGRDQLLPADFPKPENKPMNNKLEALGILETQGLTAILEATDAMLKAANVTLVGKEKIGAAYVTVIVRGDVAAVTAAIDAGSKAVGSLGKLIAAHVIARPHEDLLALLPK